MAEEAAEQGAAGGLLALMFGSAVDLETAVQQVQECKPMLTRYEQLRAAMALLNRFGVDAIEDADALILQPSVVWLHGAIDVAELHRDFFGEEAGTKATLMLARHNNIMGVFETWFGLKAKHDNRWGEDPALDSVVLYWYERMIAAGGRMALSLYRSRARFEGWADEDVCRLYTLSSYFNRTTKLPLFEIQVPRTAEVVEEGQLWRGVTPEDGWEDGEEEGDRGMGGGGGGGC